MIFDRKTRLNGVLKDLVGSTVYVSYITQSGEEQEVSGILETVNPDYIQIREPLFRAQVWINRHSTVLNTVRLLSKKKKRRKKK